MSKTTQALKISASWTPDEKTSEQMLTRVFEDCPASPLKLHGGRINLKHAIKLDFSDPKNALAVSERVAAIKSDLEKRGTVHGFSTTAGAVPVEDAEVLSPEPEKKPDAEEKTPPKTKAKKAEPAEA